MLLFLLTMSAGTVYSETGRSILNVSAVQQGTTCKGVVKDAVGETIIGASVVVKGTTNGTITGLDGDFSLSNVKAGDIIAAMPGDTHGIVNNGEESLVLIAQVLYE